ncbi:Exodeoxyribonuclease 7 large subunit [bioreactor metagenome]|uniref:Exodeoxyribonuclease 7 large subunit n=1 Tax=bioreactor metagenome TaxID=1076179 RepID=A0A644U9Y7_9ZZZZ|nr:exodeoxyribonuclease VII large subunit [Lentimicrobium sp.]MEA5110693.1 exodeoxyribonuclease VII large subunit [Lentimicrobium sp.]
MISDSASIGQEGKRVFSLSEITASIERMFSKYYASPYWIRAELSKLNHYPQSGHCYPDLVERQEGKIKAQLRGVIWRDELFEIARKFEEVTREPFREGISIMFLAYVKFTSEYGLSLQIIDIEPLYTLGELAREKMETISRLKKEGIFNSNRLLELPLLPKRLAVISAQTSKGYSDLMITLENNPWGYRFNTRLFHALLQGDGAVDSIRKQLGIIRDNQEQFDAVLIIRGGGDEIGMACYDNYLLARDVACFPLPVITGIGHSTNETVVEMVAGINKITPTDVAHFLIGCFRSFSDRIKAAEQMLLPGVMVVLETNAARFNTLSGSLLNLVKNTLREESDLVEQQALVVREATNVAVFNHRIALSRYESGLTMRPAQILGSHRATLLEQQKMLGLTTRYLVSNQLKEIGTVDSRVKLLDPVGVLKRGFTITRLKGRGIAPGNLPDPGDLLETESASGKFISVVSEKKSI